jgi:methylmalonyl-CoA mutase
MSDSLFPLVDEAAWRSQVERELGGEDFDRALTTELLEGIRVQPLYVRHADVLRQPRAYIDEALGWYLTPRYEASEPSEVHRQVMADVAGGATALWLRLDMAARSGLEADGRATGTLAGRDGVAAYHSGDLATALGGVALDGVATLLDAGANALPAAAAMIALLDGRDIVTTAVELHFNCDPLAALAQDGTLPVSLVTIPGEMAQLVRFCHQETPLGSAITVSDLPVHAAGATAVEELAMAAATLVTYLRWLEAAGRDPETSLPYILLRSAVDRDFFTAVAKLRALRAVWNKVAAACGLTAPPAARIHAVTSDRPLARRDPRVNLIRATGQTVAAVAGGADFVTTAAWDRPLGRETLDGRRLACNTQSIIGEESALGRVLDPAGGSHYVETLTDQLARRAWEMFQQIEAQGGAASALTGGWLQARLDASRRARQTAFAEGRLTLTGAAGTESAEAATPRRGPLDTELAADRALARLEEHRSQRIEAPDADRDCEDLEELTRLARTGATLGELSRALRRRRGETMEPLPRFRDEEAVP